MSLLKNKNQENQLPANWCVVLTGPVRNDIKDHVVEKISGAFSISFEDAAEMVTNLPIILLDSLSQPSAIKLKDFLKASGAEFFLTDDEKVKRKCYRAVWPDAPRISFLPETETPAEEPLPSTEEIAGPDKLIRRIQSLEQVKKTLGQSLNEKGREINAWRSKHKDIEDKLSKLQEDFNQQKERFEKAENKNTAFSNDKAKLSQELKEKDKKIHDLARVLEEEEKKYAKEISVRKEETSKIVQRLERVQEELTELKGQKDALEQSLRQKEAEAVLWENRSHGYKKEMETLRSGSDKSQRQSLEALKNLETQCDRLLAAKKEIENKCGALQESLTDEKNQHQKLEGEFLKVKKELEEKKAVLEKDLRVLSEQSSAAGEEFSRLSSAYAAEKELRQKLEAVRTSLEDERLKIEEAFAGFKETSTIELQQLKAQNQQAGTRIQELESEKEILLRESREKNDFIQQGKTEISTLQETVETIRQQTGELQKQLQEESDLRQKYEKSKSILTQDKKELEKLLQDKSAEFSGLSEKHIQIQQSFAEMQLAFEETRNDLQQKISQREHDAASWKMKAEDFSERLESLQNLKIKMEEERDSINGQFLALQENVRALEALNANLRSQVDVQNVQIRESGERERHLQESVETLKSLLGQQQESAQKREDALTEKVTSQDKEIRELSQIKEKLLDQIDRSDRQLEETRGHLHELSVRIEGFETEKNELAQALNLEKGVSEAERKAYAELQDKLTGLENEKNVLRSEAAQAAERFHALQEQLRSLETEKEKETASAREREGVLQNEIMRLKEQAGQTLEQLERLNEVREELEQLAGEKGSELDRVSEECRNLEVQLKDVRQAFQTETQRTHELQTGLDEAKTELSGQQVLHDEKIQQLSAELSERSDTVERLSGELEHIQRKYEEDRKSFDELSAEFKDINAAKSILEGIVKDQKESIEALSRSQAEDAEAWAGEKNSLRQQYEALQESYEQANVEISRLANLVEKAENKIQQITAHGENLKEELNRIQDTKTLLENELQKAAEAVRQKDEELISQKQQFDHALTREGEKVNGLQAVIEDWIIKYQDLQKNLQQITQDRENVQLKRDQLQSANEDLLDRLGTGQKRIEQLETDYRQAHQTWSEKEAEWEKERMRLLSELQTNAEKIEHMTAQMNEMHEKIRESQEIVTVQQQEKTKLETGYEALVEEHELLQTRLAEETGRLEQLAKEKATLEAQNQNESERLQAEIDRLNSEFTKANQQVTELTQHLQEADENVKALKQSVVNGNNELEMLHGQKSTLVEERDLLQKRLSEETGRLEQLAKEKATLEAQNQNESEKLQAEIDRLNSEFTKANQQVIELTAHLQEADENVKALKQSVVNGNNELEMLHGQKSTLIEERDLLQKRLAEETGRLEQLAKEKTSLEEQSLNESEKLRAEISGLSREFDEANQQIARITENLQVSDEKVRALEEALLNEKTRQEEFQAQHAALLEERKKMEGLVSEEKAKTGQLVTAYTTVQQEHARIRKNLKESENSLHIWKEKAETASKELAAVSANLQQQAAAFQTQNEKTRHLEKEHEQVMSRLADLEAKYEAERGAREQLEVLQQQINNIRQESEAVLAKERQTAEEYRLKMQELEELQKRDVLQKNEAISKLEDEVCKYRETVQKLDEDRKNIMGRSDVLSQAKADLEIRLYEYAQELEQYKSKDSHYRADVEAIRENLEQQKKQSAESQKKYQMVEKQLNDEQAKFENFRELWEGERSRLYQEKSQAAEHMADLEKTLTEIKGKADERDRLVSESERLKKELEDERGQKDLLSGKVRQFQDEALKLRAELESQSARETEKQAALDSLRKENQELLNKTPVLQQELERQFAQSQADLEKWQRESDKLNQRLTQLEGLQKTFEKQLEDKQREIESSQVWHKELNQQIADVEARAEEEKSEHLKTRERYDEIIRANELQFEETLKKERALWESKLGEINEQCRELEQIRQQLNQRAEDQSREIESWRMQCEEMSLKMESMQGEFIQEKKARDDQDLSLEKKLDESEQKRKHLEEEYLKSRRTFAEKLQQSLQESQRWKSAAENLNQEIQTLEQKKAGLEHDLSEMEKEKERLAVEIEQSSGRYKELEDDFHKARQVFQRKFEEMIDGRGSGSEDMLQVVQEQNQSLAREKKRYEEAMAAFQENEKGLSQKHGKELEHLREEVLRSQQELALWQKKSKDLGAQCKALNEDRDRLGMELQGSIQESKQWQIRSQELEKRFDQLKASHDNLEKMIMSKYPKEH